MPSVDSILEKAVLSDKVDRLMLADLLDGDGRELEARLLRTSHHRLVLVRYPHPAALDPPQMRVVVAEAHKMQIPRPGNNPGRSSWRRCWHVNGVRTGLGRCKSAEVAERIWLAWKHPVWNRHPTATGVIDLTLHEARLVGLAPGGKTRE